jgi:hypothetical protein
MGLPSASVSSISGLVVHPEAEAAGAGGLSPDPDAVARAIAAQTGYRSAANAGAWDMREMLAEAPPFETVTADLTRNCRSCAGMTDRLSHARRR